jgi:hypothetical protein
MDGSGGGKWQDMANGRQPNMHRRVIAGALRALKWVYNATGRRVRSRENAMRQFAEVPAMPYRRWWLAAVLLLCAATGLVRAQTTTDSPVSDPPDRVARLSYLAGDVGFRPAGASDWSDPGINRPLTDGDRLSTGNGARVELEFGGATVRLAGQTDAGLLTLDDRLARLELAQGTLAVTVRHLDEGQSYEIDTPTVALVIDQPGTFRVDVGAADRGTRVTVFAGQAAVYGENNAEHDVFAGRSYEFFDPALATVTVSDIGGGDAFDAWSADRDQRYAQSPSGQYVSEDVVGYQDLDAYGDWRSTDDYGAVWFPRRVGADWAPYRDGHWAYIRPWGWTWIDDAPWGFAPYHYGRWARVGDAWGWIPGPVGLRPVYAPALVVFFGGDGWNVSLGMGTAPVGWFPLGPGDIYDPWYGASRGYYSRINLRNIRWHDRKRAMQRIDEHYRRHRRGEPPPVRATLVKRDPRGYTVVPGRVFAGGGKVQRERLNIGAAQLATAPLLTYGVRRKVVARHVPAKPLVASDTRSRPGLARPLVRPHADANLPVVRRLQSAPARSPPVPMAGERVRRFSATRAMHENVPPRTAPRPLQRADRVERRPAPHAIPAPLRHADAPRPAARQAEPAHANRKSNAKRPARNVRKHDGTP